MILMSTRRCGSGDTAALRTSRTRRGVVLRFSNSGSEARVRIGASGHGDSSQESAPCPIECPNGVQLVASKKKKIRLERGMRMARPGLEPGTPRFSVVRSVFTNRLEMPGDQAVWTWCAHRPKDPQILFFPRGFGR
jgi:hypothetical protein